MSTAAAPRLGELERAVMDVLWDADGARTAGQIHQALGRPLAATTVLTVLTRLERKGFLVATRDARPHRFEAVSSRADHVAALMHDVLRDGHDTHAVLERFVSGVSRDDAAVLRGLLGGTRRA